MGLGPLAHNPVEVRGVFRKLQALGLVLGLSGPESEP